MGNSVVPKDVLARYVHDAVEMESAIYTLDKMEEECKRKKQSIISEAENDYSEAVTKFDTAKGELSEAATKDYSTYYSGPKKPEIVNIIGRGCLLSLFGGTLICSVIIVIIAFIIFLITKDESFLELDEEKLGPLVIAMDAVLLIAYCVHDYKSEQNAYKKAQFKHNEEKDARKKEALKEAQREVSYKEKSVDKANKNRTLAKNKARLIDIQINELVNKRQQIQNNLRSFYSFGLIPPDYRTFDCVMMLDQIFRNDLADTMREAIKIYEERVFRGTVIKGMDRICSMLGHLSSEMSAISLRLDMINSSVVQMGEDLNRTNQRLMNNQRELIEQSIKNRSATEELINETKLGRYINEQLLESNQVLAKYVNDKRMGII